MGSHRKFAHRRRNAMGLLRALPKLFRPASCRLPRLRFAPKLARRRSTSITAKPTTMTAFAARGRAWSLLRNRLCALTSVNGGFGFTCGVEWLAAEKIKVHDCTGLAWGSRDNIVSELAQLNQLLADHPCFFDSAKLTRLESGRFAGLCTASRIRRGQGLPSSCWSIPMSKRRIHSRLTIPHIRNPLSVFNLICSASRSRNFSQGKIKSLSHSVPAPAIASLQQQSRRV